MKIKVLCAATFLYVVSFSSYSMANCSGMELNGRFEPTGAEYWNVTIDFDAGEGVHSKEDGARATRQVGAHTCAAGQISFTLNSGEPVGVPDLTCTGSITGKTVQGRCIATGGHPEERFSGTLKKK